MAMSPGASFACIVISCFVVVFEFTCGCEQYFFFSACK